MAQKKLEVEDRVKRKGGEGCLGSVKEIREEIGVPSARENSERPKIIGVLWDNGTMSFFSPEGLEAAQ